MFLTLPPLTIFIRIFMSTIQNTPLHDFHLEHHARFVDFSGWNMPVQYSSILEEHEAVRTAAGLFDVSHMGELSVTGVDAAHFLDRLLVNHISRTPVGKAVYSPMCAADGGVVDDLIVYRTAAETFLLCVNAANTTKDFEWCLKHVQRWRLDVQVEDHSGKYALLALQGPKAAKILERIGFDSLQQIRTFGHARCFFSDEPVRLCRTGYTGEDGFELYLSPQAAESLARAIMRAGSSYGLRPCGLGCRDSLRLEAGYPLYGHELSDTITPLEAGLAWTVKFQKDDFIGKDALIEQHKRGIPRRVIHFKLDGRRIARAGTPIITPDGQTVGQVLSGTLSPVLACPIGSAIVTAKAPATDLLVELRGNPIKLNLAQPPLHKKVQ